MVQIENYNKLVGDLVDSLEIVITKDDKIICCTNGHSPIAYELEGRGYDALEVPVKKYDGKCDILITKTSDSDIVRLMDNTDENIKLFVMYNRLFTGDTAQKIEKYHKGNIGTSTSIQENGRAEPFDNRIFMYSFSDGGSE